ncbi:MAG TPA: hypothetical protein VH080_06970 [Gemmatimonadaceae bacterium]|nr:hypothetical protein [Gemmatimonadaceae bacterium]
MPIVPFESLPDASRVWVFGSDRALSGEDAERLLAEVDRFLSQWKAHGVPLSCARDWRDAHLLTVGVDSTVESASGCSIDGLFRILHSIERPLGTRLLGGGRVFYRDENGRVQCVTRDRLPELAKSHDVNSETPVFDTGLTTAGQWRSRFESPARTTWVGDLLGVL